MGLNFDQMKNFNKTSVIKFDFLLCKNVQVFSCEKKDPALQFVTLCTDKLPLVLNTLSHSLIPEKA